MNGYKVFSASHYDVCYGYICDSYQAVVVAENVTVALGLCLERYPTTTARNWLIHEVDTSRAGVAKFD